MKHPLAELSAPFLKKAVSNKEMEAYENSTHVHVKLQLEAKRIIIKIIIGSLIFETIIKNILLLY